MAKTREYRVVSDDWMWTSHMIASSPRQAIAYRVAELRRQHQEVAENAVKAGEDPDEAMETFCNAGQFEAWPDNDWPKGADGHDMDAEDAFHWIKRRRKARKGN